MSANPTVVFTQPGTVVVEDHPIPAPDAGQVLIRTRRSLISIGTELTVLRGEYPPNSIWDHHARFPYTPGYCNIGEVVDVGADVDPSLIGVRVATLTPHAQYVTASTGDLRIIQRDIRDESAVFVTIAVIVANAVRRSSVQWGEAVVVYGLGLLGQFAVRLCHHCGARPVVGVDVAETRLARLPEVSGCIAVNGGEQDVRAVVSELTRGRMADVVFEVTGTANLIPGEFAPLRNQGRFVVLSSPSALTSFDFSDLCNGPSYHIIGAHNFSHPTHATLDNPWTMARDYELYFDLVAGGDIDPKPLITHQQPYSSAPDLYQTLLVDRTQALGVILEWDT